MKEISHYYAAAASLGMQPRDFMVNALELTRKNFGNKIEFCGIINISETPCGMDCHFCAQNRYALKNNQIYKKTDHKALIDKLAKSLTPPVSHMGVVSTGSKMPLPRLEKLLDALATLPPQIRQGICLSIGHLDIERIRLIRQAGIKRCHHNLETSKEHYPSICSTQTWEQRERTVALALENGLEMCSGAIFGIGEKWKDRVSLARTLKKLDVKYVPMNFLHPVAGTPLENKPVMDTDEALACIMLFRNILPNATLRLCGGRKNVFAHRETEIFAAGINALMTGDFLTTKGRSRESDLELLRKCNLEIVIN